MHLPTLFRRRAFNSVALASLLVPAADVVRREVTPEPAARPAEAEAAVALADVSALEAAPAAAKPGAVTADPDVAAAHALEKLAPAVRRLSHPSALETALRAYYAYREAHPERVKKPYFYFVDMGLDNLTPRGYVFDMNDLSVVDGPFMVAHGNGSGSGANGVPTRFSNRAGSKATSLGIYLAQETYRFSGKSGGRAYTSVGLRLRGESPGFNDAARARGIVAHGAPYVTSKRAGRSEGCPAMEPHRAARLLPMLANGGVVLVYSPNDARWLASDPWVQAARSN